MGLSTASVLRNRRRHLRPSRLYFAPSTAPAGIGRDAPDFRRIASGQRRRVVHELAREALYRGGRRRPRQDGSSAAVPAAGDCRADMKIVGRAMPVLEADVFDEASSTARGPLGARPSGLMLEALDDLKPHSSTSRQGGSFRYALWGELMSTRATRLRAAGAVLNGFVRDAAGIEALNFPTFRRGVYAQDQGPRGKVIDFRSAIEIEGIRIAPGDLVFGDREGVDHPRQRRAGRRRRARKGRDGEQGGDRHPCGHESAREAFDTIRRAVRVVVARGLQTGRSPKSITVSTQGEERNGEPDTLFYGSYRSDRMGIRLANYVLEGFSRSRRQR